jgi:ABC-type nitrate/sulfonate/bicarbonate transport system substrate-binding protein
MIKPNKLMKALALPALSVLLFCGCGENAAGNGENAGGNTAEPETIRFVLDWSPNTNHTGLYAAQDRGWFAEEGLAVKILSPPEDGALLLLGSGRAEFAVDFQESLGPAIAREDPLPVQAVASVISHNSSGLMSLKSAGIKRPRDLAGKRFASWETPLVRTLRKRFVVSW